MLHSQGRTGQQKFGGPEVAELRVLAERASAKEAELSADVPLGYPRYGQVSWDTGEPLQDTAIVPFWNLERRPAATQRNGRALGQHA